LAPSFLTATAIVWLRTENFLPEGIRLTDVWHGGS
jgi:hypothetical protein